MQACLITFFNLQMIMMCCYDDSQGFGLGIRAKHASNVVLGSRCSMIVYGICTLGI